MVRSCSISFFHPLVTQSPTYAAAIRIRPARFPIPPVTRLARSRKFGSLMFARDVATRLAKVMARSFRRPAINWNTCAMDTYGPRRLLAARNAKCLKCGAASARPYGRPMVRSWPLSPPVVITVSSRSTNHAAIICASFSPAPIGTSPHAGRPTESELPSFVY